MEIFFAIDIFNRLTFDKNGLIIIAQNMHATSMTNYILQGKLEIDKTEILAKQNKFAMNRYSVKNNSGINDLH